MPEDVLHLRARIGEKLVNNLSLNAADHQANKLAPRFQDLIRSAGVPFKISEAIVHGKNQIVFSSLTGGHWRRLLPQLPTLIRNSSDVFPEPTKEPLAEVIEMFVDCLAFAGKCNKEDAEDLAAKTNAFLTAFLNLEEKGLKGFGKGNITPYLHWLHCHVPFSVSLFGGLDKLSGELLEAQNDEIKKTHSRRTHCKDVRMTLQMEKRREAQQMAEELERKEKTPRLRKQGPLHPW